ARRAAPLYPRPARLPAVDRWFARAAPHPRPRSLLAGGSAMIEVENLTVRFSGAAAVDNVSFTVAEGESFGLVGESGSGKSTILRTMVGLNRHWTGRISIAGLDARATRQRDLARTVQMVFQDPYGSLHPR